MSKLHSGIFGIHYPERNTIPWNLTAAYRGLVGIFMIRCPFTRLYKTADFFVKTILKSKCNGFTKVFNFITLTKVLDVKLQPATFPKLTRFHRCRIFWIDSPFIQSPCKFDRLTNSSSLPLTKKVLLTLTQKARSKVCYVLCNA